jgi:hypothetical protein
MSLCKERNIASSGVQGEMVINDEIGEIQTSCKSPSSSKS